MAIRRLALIFGDRIPPDTIGVRMRPALVGLIVVVHFQPDQCDPIPASGFDLYFSIDDDSERGLATTLRTRAYCTIDTHVGFPARFDRSMPCDFVFAAQCDGAERLRDAGIESAVWLPLACDPEIHRRHDAGKEYDFCFVGNVVPGPRAELLERPKSRYPGHFAGSAYLDDMARIYSASRVVFNRSVRNDVNMRVFEAVACGSLLVTNDLTENGQGELFQDGVHLATYREADELLEKVAYYLEHEEEREAIAAAGRAEALARHTYRHRMERLLAEVEARLSRTVVAAGAVGSGPANAGEPTSPRRPAATAEGTCSGIDFDHHALLQPGGIHAALPAGIDPAYAAALGADRRRQRLDRWHCCVPRRRSGYVARAGDRDHQCHEPGFPRGHQPGVETRPG
jgi:hypothetical protein